MAVFAGTGALALSGGAVAYAVLAATATGTNTASSGTLSLAIGANGVGFSQPVANLAPGDVVNRYVTLTNNGTLDGADLGLSVTGTGSTALTTDATKGLAVSVWSCSGAWTPATGVCSGSSTQVLTSPVASLSGPTTMISGAVVVGTSRNLRLSVSLPDSAETTVNGVPPSGTIQGLTTTLTYTFSQKQRPATTTNS